MVSIGLDTKPWTHKCVGTIITSNAILTSSKCLEKIDEMKTITAGAENLQSPEPGTYVETYEVKNYVSSESNDLAVVYTTKKHAL